VGLFGRSTAVEVTVSPSVVLPRQSVEATVAVPKPIDKVTSARIELGYTNFYRYRWAGRADSAAAAASEAMWLTEDVGTNYGTDRDTSDWVSVLTTELPVSAGEFTGGRASFRVPSWAPGSSPQIARWACRLVVERGGRDVDEHGELTVVIGTAHASTEVGPLERVAGTGAAVLDVTLSSPVYRAGDTVNGLVTISPTRDLPDGDLGVCWQFHRYSHPLERTPGPGEAADGPIVNLGKRIPLQAGASVALPFAVALPADAAPTASAVHSSLGWFIQARMYYAGWKGPLPERVRLPFVVVNAP
jgi:hypothetical protein